MKWKYFFAWIMVLIMFMIFEVIFGYKATVAIALTTILVGMYEIQEKSK